MGTNYSWKRTNLANKNSSRIGRGGGWACINVPGCFLHPKKTVSFPQLHYSKINKYHLPKQNSDLQTKRVPPCFLFCPFQASKGGPIIWLHIETWLPHLQHQFFRLLQHSLFMQQPTTHGHGRGGGKVQTLQPKNHSRCGMSTVKMATFWHKKNGGKFTSFRRHFPGATPNNPWVNFTYQIIRPFLKSVSLTQFFTKLHN